MSNPHRPAAPSRRQVRRPRKAVPRRWTNQPPSLLIPTPQPPMPKEAAVRPILDPEMDHTPVQPTTSPSLATHNVGNNGAAGHGGQLAAGAHPRPAAGAQVAT